MARTLKERAFNELPDPITIEGETFQQFYDDVITKREYQFYFTKDVNEEKGWRLTDEKVVNYKIEIKK